MTGGASLLVKHWANAKLVQKGIALLVVVNDRKMCRVVKVKCLIYATECFRRCLVTVQQFSKSMSDGFELHIAPGILPSLIDIKYLRPQ